MSGMSGHEKPYKGKTNEWHTPPYILEALKPFDDDPAIPDSLDGFLRPWTGFVWLNPPYGPSCKDWMRKMADHKNGIALTFARTETKWFVSEVWERADALLFIYGRLKFLRNGKEKLGNAGAPSVLIAYGQEAVQRLAKSNLQGALIHLWNEKVEPQ